MIDRQRAHLNGKHTQAVFRLFFYRAYNAVTEVGVIICQIVGTFYSWYSKKNAYCCFNSLFPFNYIAHCWFQILV